MNPYAVLLNGLVVEGLSFAADQGGLLTAMVIRHCRTHRRTRPDDRRDDRTPRIRRSTGQRFHLGGQVARQQTRLSHAPDRHRQKILPVNGDTVSDPIELKLDRLGYSCGKGDGHREAHDHRQGLGMRRASASWHRRSVGEWS